MKNKMLFSAISLLLAGCSTLTPDANINARNAGLNAAGSEALRQAGKILGTALTSTLFSVAQSEATGQKVDYLQSGSQALFAQADSATAISAAGSIFSAFSAGKAKFTAKAVDNAAKTAISNGQDPSKVATAIAAVVATATGAPPAK